MQINDARLHLVFEDKLYDDEGYMSQEPAIWVPSLSEDGETIHIGNVDRGDIRRNIPVTLKARPVYRNTEDETDIRYSPAPGYELYTGMDVRNIRIEVYGENNPIASVASKTITLPELSDEKLQVGFTSFEPSFIYYEGYSYITVTGFGRSFNAMADKTNWTAYLRNVITGEIINIDSFACGVDTEGKLLGLGVIMNGKLGVYELTIEFRNHLQSLGKHVFSEKITSSDDERYRNRGYSIVSVARIAASPAYEMRLFFADKGIPAETQFNTYRTEIEDAGGEMLMEGRGLFKVLYRDGVNLDTLENTEQIGRASCRERV